MRRLTLDEIESGISAHLDAIFAEGYRVQLTTEEIATYRRIEATAATDLIRHLDRITTAAD